MYQFAKMSKKEKREIGGGAAFLTWFVSIAISLKFLLDSGVTAYKVISSDEGEIENSEVMGGGSTKWANNEDKSQTSSTTTVPPIIYAW